MVARPSRTSSGISNRTWLNFIAERWSEEIFNDSDEKTNQAAEDALRLPSWYCPFPKDDVFARFLKLIKENFVHCRLGDDRTRMMIAACRMGVQGWTSEQAMKEMQDFGYTAEHHVMCPGLAGYEESFPERLRNSTALGAVR